MGIDDRLKDELGRLASADPSGAYEKVVAKYIRRRVLRKAQAGALVVAVVVGTAFGFYGLTQVFRSSSPTPGGSPAQPAVAPSNGAIAYVMGSGVERSEIYVVDPMAGSPERIAEIDGFVSGLDWSPDGRLLAFGLHPDGLHPDGGIFVMDAAGNGLRRLSEPGLAAWGVSWSPDGERIASAVSVEGPGEDAIYVMNADGSDAHVITRAPEIGPTLDWSPDGGRIVFEGPGPEGASGGWDIYVVNADGSGLRNITNDPAVDLDPQWSPDGSQIVFRSRRSSPPDTEISPNNSPDEIYVMAPDGSNVTRLTNDRVIDQDPVWSPDGSLIAFDRQEGESSIWTMRPDGTGLAPVSGTRGGFRPAWQPVPVES